MVAIASRRFFANFRLCFFKANLVRAPIRETDQHSKETRKQGCVLTFDAEDAQETLDKLMEIRLP